MKTRRRTTLAQLLLVALLAALSTVCNALYDADPHVQTFASPKEFRAKVADSPSVTLLQFYAPWCGHCQQFRPYYSKLAEVLDGIVNVAAVDGTSDGPMGRVAGEYGVSGFPTLKIVRPRGKGQKAAVIDLNTRDVSEIANLVVKAVGDTIQDRAGAPPGADTGSSSSSGGGPSAVVELDGSNFDKYVYQNADVVAVAFVAPWCGHCKQLLPEWSAAAESLSKSGATLATVDATVETQLASEFGVQGFPTIKIFPGGAKSGSRDAMDYQGGRTKEQIVSYVLQEVDRSGVPKEIPELVGPAVLEEICGDGGGNTLCVFVALPHILDTGAEGRNRYKDVMTAASKAVRGMPFEFLWFEGGNHQGKLENALELTFGFPAVAAYSKEKGVYAVHRGSFTEANLRKFLMGIMAGRMATYPITDELVVVETEPWDGKDGEPIEEESLADIMGWDDDEDGDGDEL